jgi:polyisoprenoid-binding protein YceI
MRRLRYGLLITALASIIALSFFGARHFSSTVEAQGNTKVKYAPIPGGDYKIDPAHSIIGFAIRHFEINWVEGRFKDFNGAIRLDDKDITRSSVEFTAKAASIDTGVEGRDKHLRTADFFEVEKYPELSFKSTGVERKGKERYVLKGDLTIKGVTKPVAIPFTITGAVVDTRDNTRIGIEGQTKINRRDFGVNWGHALPVGGADVGDEVTINLNLEAIKPGPKPAGQ